MIMRTILGALCVLGVAASSVYAGPRLTHGVGMPAMEFTTTYQEDEFGNQLPAVFELYTRLAGEVVQVIGQGENSRGLELTYIGPDGHIVRSRPDASKRPRLTYVNARGARGWGVLIIQDNQGNIVHQDARFSYSRRLSGQRTQSLNAVQGMKTPAILPEGSAQ